jgi:Gpi18-like mannosyltransferase
VLAGTNLSASVNPRPLRLGDLLIAGWPAPVAVTLAGLTLGFFGWYAFFVPSLTGAASEIGLIGAMLGVTALSIAAWLVYSRYLSHRAGITLARSLRYDALTWPPFLLLWFTFVSSSPLTHGARLFLVAAAVFCIGKVLIAARFNQTVREVLIDFAATRIAIIVIAELAAVIIGQRAGTHVQESSHVLLAVWGRWDAVHYLDIATQGYQGTDMAFFPLYPLLIRLVGALAGNHLIAGLLISNASFFLGLLYLYKLLEHEYDRAVARRAIFYVSIFPTAVYFTAVYTESLFFMLTVASVL